MPIGVPRIIYCWGEELPAQWTDIYNFIFRRRMVFLMQYLDDELCNQICGLLINIHMEDRSKELEKKELERSGVFKTKMQRPPMVDKKQNEKNGPKGSYKDVSMGSKVDSSYKLEGLNSKKKSRSINDLLNADEDLGIEDIDALEQYTLQKITTEWLNWNAQLFDYSEDPYLFYLTNILSKDFNKNNNHLKNNIYLNSFNELSTHKNIAVGSFPNENFSSVPFEGRDLKNKSHVSCRETSPNIPKECSSSSRGAHPLHSFGMLGLAQSAKGGKPRKDKTQEISFILNMLSKKSNTSLNSPSFNHLREEKVQGLNDVYAPFRTHTKIVDGDLKLKNVNSFPPLLWSGSPFGKKKIISAMLDNIAINMQTKNDSSQGSPQEGMICKLLANLSNVPLRRKESTTNFLKSLFLGSFSSKKTSLHLDAGNEMKADENKIKGSEKKTLPKGGSIKQSQKVLSQTKLRREYIFEKKMSNFPALPMEALQNTSPRCSKAVTSLEKSAYQFKDSGYKGISKNVDSLNYLSSSRDFYRKQTEQSLIEEESKKIFVIINSFGGSVGNGVTVHDALQFIKAGSLTLALGIAASAASLALAGGSIGERYVTEGCHVMLHQPEGGLQGQASDIWIDSQEIMKIRLDVAEIYSLSTYRPRHKILRDLDRDFYLTATETIHYGLADEIATNEVMHEIIEMTSKVWDYHDSKQQNLLDKREKGIITETQTQ